MGDGGAPDGPSIRDISRELNKNVAGLVKILLPAAIKAGGFWHVGNVHGKSGDSLKIKPNGTWADYSCDRGDPEGTGDMLKLLWLTIGNKDWGQTLKWARDWLGHDSMDPHALAKHRERARIEEERAEVERADRVAKSQIKARNLWGHASPLLGTPGQRYLEGVRGIDFSIIGRLPGSMRFRPDVWHADLRRRVPALLTAGIRNRQHIATHCIYLHLRPDGQWDKLPDLIVDGRRLKVAKKIFGQAPQGVHFPVNKGLSRKTLNDMPAGERLHSGEGAEDALTYAMINPAARVVFAGTLGNLGCMDVPPQCGDMVFLAQRDADGSKAQLSFEKQVTAQQLRGREDGSGRDVLCHWPGEGFKDLNDEWRGIIMNGGGNGAQD
jgi:hypothetical protein